MKNSLYIKQLLIWLLAFWAISSLFSCKRYEKKILKVEIQSSHQSAFAWEKNGAFGACESNNYKVLYLKENDLLYFQNMCCGGLYTNHLTIKVKNLTLYDGNAALQTVNVIVKRK